MKVVDKREKVKEISFNDLKAGKCFELHRNFGRHMKLELPYDMPLNTVCLEDGFVHHVPEKTLVFPLSAELHILE